MDVMLLVDIDVATGRTAMIGLPRNLTNAPFPPGAARDAVPCGCLRGLLNEAYVEATIRHPDRWPGTGAGEGNEPPSPSWPAIRRSRYRTSRDARPTRLSSRVRAGS